MFDSLQKFVSYWYFRYLLVTELYMVEKWERVMIYIVFVIFFTCLALFNNWVVLSAMDTLVRNQKEWTALPPLELMQSLI